MLAYAEGMDEITFMDQQANSGGYVTRYLITERYLRMDFGQNGDDFVLFDRQEKRVYNVTHDQRQILLIEPGAATIPKPEKWDVRDDVLVDERGTRTFDIVVNGIKCSRISAAQNFLPDVAQAVSDFNEVMSATQATTYLATPPEMRHPCDLAHHVLAPRFWLKNGLPLYQADADGAIRRLLNYQTDLPLKRSLFSLPDYRTIRLRDLQGGAKP